MVLSLLVVFLFNRDQILVRHDLNVFPTPPATTFFDLSDENMESIPRPQLHEIRQFRGGRDRQAYYEVSYDPDRLRMQKVGLDTQVNFDAHTASKASPMESENYLILAGDYGSVQVLNKNDLSLHWKFELFDSGMGFHGTPITFFDYAFMGDYSGKLYFLDLKKKKVIWVNDLGDALGATPFFDGEYIYANVELSGPANGYLVKIDPFAKKIIWQTRYIGEQSHSTPASSDGALFFGDNDGDFYRIDASTGGVRWKVYFKKPIKSTPALWGRLVIFSSWDGRLYALDRETGATVWSYLAFIGNQSSVAVDPEKGIGYLNSTRGIHKIDLRNGQELGLLKMSMNSDTRKASPVIVVNGKKKRVLTGCYERKLCLLDPDNFREIQTFDLDSSISNQVGVFANSILVVTDGGQGINILRPF